MLGYRPPPPPPPPQTKMNAQSYLQSYGWTPGTSLGNPLSHSPSTARLTKRILISTKNNTLGVGRKASNLNHADLWWEKAFDVSLKQLDVNKDTSAIPKPQKDAVDNMNLFAQLGGGRGFGGTSSSTGPSSSKNRVDSTGPLYRHFVRGEGLEGTIVASPPSVTTLDTKLPPAKKRKRDHNSLPDATPAPAPSKLVKKALKAERKRLRVERRAAKAERRKLRAERRAARTHKRNLKAEKRSKKTLQASESKTKTPPPIKDPQHAATKSTELSDSGVDLSSDETPLEEILPPTATKTPKEKKQREKKSQRPELLSLTPTKYHSHLQAESPVSAIDISCLLPRSPVSQPEAQR
ncbi:hypothetical protein DRE_07260 [Drechslerella stenobrocha 248]|uniref:G-patch domain-containing protein n=1 Tax=Drechslerella stenobrocha 248 TaxID=1043628 RepID=W7HVF1_9PEZI|nr:hypothetical protein DRE_07260 [Drechslerella stenobrocha 248]